MTNFVKLRDDIILNIDSIRSIQCGFKPSEKTSLFKKEIKVPILRVIFHDNTSADYYFDTIEDAKEHLEDFNKKLDKACV